MGKQWLRRLPVDARALPIALGYLPVAFAFGLTASALHLPAWFTAGLSLFVYAGASQFAALHLIATGAGTAATVLGIAVVNLRMALESLAFFRRAQWPRTEAWRSLILTDEVFVAASLGERPTPREFLRLAWLPYSVWVLGSLFGALTGSLLPSILRSALGISLDALFVALLVGAAKEDSRSFLAAAVGGAVALMTRSIGAWSLVAGMLAGAAAYIVARRRSVA